MAKYTRGEFLGFGAAFVGAFRLDPGRGDAPTAAFAQPPALSSGGEPDFMVVNARVLTSDTAAPRAQAFAVKSGRFTAVGSNDEVRNLATAGATVIDAQQMTIVPGFIDA